MISTSSCVICPPGPETTTVEAAAAAAGADATGAAVCASAVQATVKPKAETAHAAKRRPKPEEEGMSTFFPQSVKQKPPAHSALAAKGIDDTVFGECGEIKKEAPGSGNDGRKI